MGDGWIGYSDQQKEGSWVWSNPAGQCKTFTQWNSGEPNGGTRESCAQLLNGNGNWNDVPCGNKYVSICEIGNKAKTLCPTGM